MALSFPNVSILGINRESRFFDAGFQYSSFKRVSIAGTVNDLTETFGITGVWNGPQGVLATIRNNHDYDAIILNNINFGSGRIENISFNDGNDVRIKGYSANIVIFDSGNLFNFTGQNYSGIDSSNFQYLQNFTEDYTLSHQLNGGYSYTQNATIQFTSGVGQLNSISSAQSLARTLFTGGSLGFAFYPSYTNKQGKRYITETINQIDNTCGFQQVFSFDHDDGAYSATNVRSIQLSEEGVVTAIEEGSIQGIENPTYQNALSAIAIQLTGSYYRCSGAVNYYFPTGNILITSPVSQGRSIDIFNNNIGYTITFNNDPKNQRFYFWDYTLQAEKQDGISTITENGSVVGRGENPSTAFTNAQSGLNIVKGGIQTRCGNLFVTPYNPAPGFLESKQESYSPQEGECGYSYKYSNDPSLISNSGIRRKIVSEETEYAIYSYNKIGVFNVAEIAQDNYQATQASKTINVEMQGDRSVQLANYLALAVAEINSRIPVGNDRYVGAVSYSFTPNDGAAEVQLTWLYNNSASKTINP